MVLVHAMLSPHAFGHFWLCAEHGISVIVSRSHLSPPSSSISSCFFPGSCGRWQSGITLIWIWNLRYSGSSRWLTARLQSYEYSFTFTSSFLLACSTLKSQPQARTVYLNNFFLLAPLVSLSETQFSILAICSGSTNAIRPRLLSALCSWLWVTISPQISAW